MGVPVGQVKRPSRKVYLGNIDERVSRRVLYELCCLAGPVVELHTPKANPGTRRFAFVHYADPEAAAYAVCLLNGTVKLFGQPLNVNFANDGGTIVTPPPIRTTPTPGYFNSSDCRRTEPVFQQPDESDWQCYSPTAAATNHAAFSSYNSVATENKTSYVVPTREVTPPDRKDNYHRQQYVAHAPAHHQAGQQQHPAGFTSQVQPGFPGFAMPGGQAAHHQQQLPYSPSQLTPPPPPPLPTNTPPPMPSNTPPPIAPPPPAQQHQTVLHSYGQVPAATAAGTHAYGQQQQYGFQQQQQQQQAAAYGVTLQPPPVANDAGGYLDQHNAQQQLYLQQVQQYGGQYGQYYCQQQPYM
mmetsp:Transcript_32664/g.58475  ORF Transcript_32664/g.58475 Transcript_32664/m.58475 type:complete len:354 (-) Transcript_32664:376-1437(-)